MKRVIFVAHLQSHIRNFHIPYLKHLKEKGYYVAVATRVDNIGELNFLDKVIDIPFTRSPFSFKVFINYKLLSKEFEEGAYDIIHCHTPVAGVLTRIAAKKLRPNVKVYYTAHGFHFYKGAPLINWMIYYPAELYCARFTDVLFTINKEDFNLAKEKFKHTNVQLLSGVGVNTRCNNIVKNHDQKNINLLSVGELNKNKNHIIVLKALKEINNPNIHYYIAGEGNQKEKLLNYAKANGLEQNLHLLGFVKPVSNALQQKDIFVFPSIREGLSLALMEAMAYELPCIVSNIRGNNELIDPQGGYLVKEFSEYVNAIDSLVSSSKKRQIFGEYNKRKVQRYAYDIVEKELDKFYEI